MAHLPAWPWALPAADGTARQSRRPPYQRPPAAKTSNVSHIIGRYDNWGKPDLVLKRHRHGCCRWQLPSLWVCRCRPRPTVGAPSSCPAEQHHSLTAVAKRAGAPSSHPRRSSSLQTRQKSVCVGGGQAGRKVAPPYGCTADASEKAQVGCYVSSKGERKHPAPCIGPHRLRLAPSGTMPSCSGGGAQSRLSNKVEQHQAGENTA